MPLLQKSSGRVHQTSVGVQKQPDDSISYRNLQQGMALVEGEECSTRYFGWMKGILKIDGRVCTNPQVLAIQPINVLQGMLPILWESIQATHLKGDKLSAKRWAQDFLEHLVQAAHSLWDKRNQILHKREGTSLLSWTDKELNTRIRRQFRLGHWGIRPENIICWMRTKQPC